MNQSSVGGFYYDYDSDSVEMHKGNVMDDDGGCDEYVLVEEQMLNENLVHRIK